MIEVFKTNVRKTTESRILLRALAAAFPASRINFDLSDCDRVLRVEGDDVEAHRVMVLVEEHGFRCEMLD